LAPPGLREARALYRQLPAAIRLAAVDDAASHRVLLATDPEARGLVREAALPPPAHFELTDLEDGTYYLTAASIDADGLEGPPTAPLALQVRLNPGAPLTQTPEHGAGYRPERLRFSWLNVPQAAVYQLQVARDPDFVERVVVEDALKDPAFRPPRLEPGSYHFRVRSLAADGFESLWSDTLAFEVLTPPAAPELTPPAAAEGQLIMRWKDQGPGVTYHFQMAAEPDFAEPLADQVVDRPEITLAAPEAAGTYYVRTSAIAADGYEGAFSLAQSFEVARQVPWDAVGFAAFVLLAILIAL
jgi:hypothetical protein